MSAYTDSGIQTCRTADALLRFCLREMYTRRMDNGDCAIGHGVELVEAAGLKAGGHEQHVHPGCDAVCHGHVESHPPPALLMPARLHLSAKGQSILVRSRS